MDLYTIRSTANGFICSKLDENMEVQEFYTMTKRGNAISCTCASRKPWCKHCDILSEFQKTSRINTGAFFTSEKNWLPPIEIIV